MKNFKPLFLLVLSATLMLSSCSRKVEYGNAQEQETVTTEFGSYDLQLIANEMVDNMLASPAVAEITAHQRPVIAVDRIRNKTLEHIDTESVTDSIITKLMTSGKFRFTDITRMEDVKKQLNLQAESGLYDPATTAQIGKMTGARYMMYGNLSSIVKRTKSEEDVYYKFTLTLLDLESGLREWQAEKEIRKTSKRSFLGL